MAKTPKKSSKKVSPRSAGKTATSDAKADAPETRKTAKGTAKNAAKSADKNPTSRAASGGTRAAGKKATGKTAAKTKAPAKAKSPAKAKTAAKAPPKPKASTKPKAAARKTTKTGAKAATKAAAIRAGGRTAARTSRGTARAAKPAAKPAATTTARGRKAARPKTAAAGKARASAAAKAPAKTRAPVKTAAKTASGSKPRATATPSAAKGPARTATASARSTTKSAAKPNAKAAAKPAAKTAAKPTAKPAGKRAAAPTATPALPASRPAPRANRTAQASRRASLTASRTAARPLPPAEDHPAAPAVPPKPAVPATRPTPLPPATRRAAPPPAVRRQALPMVVEPKGPAEGPAKPRSILSRRKAAVPDGVKVLGRMAARFEEILTPEALEFVAALHRRFEGRRRELLRARTERQARFDAGELPDFLSETRHIRQHTWQVAQIPADLQDRRVEITGPTDRKMIINALNSGAKVFMADFEDATSPTWTNLVEGQINLKDRWHGAVFDHTDPDTGKRYELGDTPAVLIVRPRGLHLVERHVEVDGRPMSGSLFDFGLYVFHNAKAALADGSGPYVYLPKLESHLEARLWNEVFLHTESALGIHRGTIKATVLIETLPAAFEMHEILHELRDHVVGLNCGRWDYIFSFIKKLARNDAFVLPDRGQVVMGKAFLKAYSQLLVQTCHRRGAFAMGGMAAQIPIKGDQERNEAAFAKVRADKEREAGDGHDGTWVAHPDLVPVAMEVFDRLMPGRNQLDELREDVDVGQTELLEVPQGTRTEAGFRDNIRVGVQYIEAWLRGKGAVPIYGLMEDAATAEIARAQIWQWIKYGAKLDDGTQVTPAFFEKALHEEMEQVRQEVGEEAFEYGRFPEATQLFHKLSLTAEFEEFLTIPAYALID